MTFTVRAVYSEMYGSVIKVKFRKVVKSDRLTGPFLEWWTLDEFTVFGRGRPR